MTKRKGRNRWWQHLFLRISLIFNPKKSRYQQTRSRAKELELKKLISSNPAVLNPFKKARRVVKKIRKTCTNPFKNFVQATESHKKIKSEIPFRLERPESNPILKPYERNLWESQATFNPAVIYADKKVHLIYRAVGTDDVSVLGYACSYDGLHIHERLADPVFRSRRKDMNEHTGTRIAFASGGGWNGGCEDPRMTCIDDVVYLLYTAFDGWGSVRIALSSIPLKHFLHKQWDWTDPVPISSLGSVNKNWVIFPEKIHGKFAILHSISPKIRIHYFESMDDFQDENYFIESAYVKTPRSRSWDNWVRGAGPPPIKTEAGWLLLYHAMDYKDPNRYKLGAMLLDLSDPTKVLYRSKGPILEPEACYENEGFKSGVVYSCGAVVVDGRLYVYYGGADTVTCVAVADLDHFLKDLMSTGKPKICGVAKLKQTKYAPRKTIKKKSYSVA